MARNICTHYQHGCVAPPVPETRLSLHFVLKEMSNFWIQLQMSPTDPFLPLKRTQQNKTTSYFIAGKGSGANWTRERVSGSYGVFFPRCTLYFSARPVRPLVPPLQSASRHEDEARFLHVKFCKLCAFRPLAPSLVQDGRLLEMQPTAIPGQIQRGSQRISWYPNCGAESRFIWASSTK